MTAAGTADEGAAGADREPAWAAEAVRLFQSLRSAAEAGAGADHSAECRYCPLCQGLAVLRRAGPDLLDQVAGLATGFAAALRAAEETGEDPGRPAGPLGPDPGGGPGAAAARPAPPRTERIDITD
jgi:hypothetical protein